jgi:flagellar basal body-associated protein FliL
LPRGVTGFPRRPFYRHGKGEYDAVSILWIILIVVLVLALLGFFSRSVW